MKAPKNILLVDDDKDDQDFFIEALSEIKTETLYYVVNNGKEALEKLESSAILPDLIFMDIHMPLMNGVECLTAIVNNPKIKNIPVVILTSSTTEMELVSRLGAKAFIKKSGYIKLLREQIEQIINLDFIFDSHIANQTFKTEFLTFKPN